MGGDQDGKFKAACTVKKWLPKLVNVIIWVNEGKIPLKVLREILVIVVNALESCMGADVKLSNLGQAIRGEVSVRGLPTVWYKMEQYIQVIGDKLALSRKPPKSNSKIKVCIKVICIKEISNKTLKSVAIHLSELTEMSATLDIKEWQCIEGEPAMNVFNSVSMDIAEINKRTQGCINVGIFKSLWDQNMAEGKINIRLAKLNTNCNVVHGYVPNGYDLIEERVEALGISAHCKKAYTIHTETAIDRQC